MLAGALSIRRVVTEPPSFTHPSGEHDQRRWIGLETSHIRLSTRASTL
jgi:hypothetical protein